MNRFPAYRKKNRWINILTPFISLSFMIIWLPFVRSICDGKSYQWAMDFFGILVSGQGVELSIIYLVAFLILYALIFVGLYRIRNRVAFYFLLCAYWILVYGNLIFDIVKSGSSEFHGDTLDVHVSLTSIVLAISAVTLFLILKLIHLERNDDEIVLTDWNSKNKRLLLIFLSTLPIVLILLSTGSPHGLTDQIGVLIAIAQCFYIPLIFWPYK